MKMFDELRSQTYISNVGSDMLIRKRIKYQNTSINCYHYLSGKQVFYLPIMCFVMLKVLLIENGEFVPPFFSNFPKRLFS